jgi:DNA polymerase-4
LLSVAGLREIGSLAALTDEDARALLGKRGLALRDAARGQDDSRVQAGGLQEKSVRRRLDFAAEALDSGVIRGAIFAVAEDAGWELRREGLAAGRLKLSVSYADGGREEAEERLRPALNLDAQLGAAGLRAYARAGVRRVRVRGLGLSLSELAPASRELELFGEEGFSRMERLQGGLDAARRRYGLGSVKRAATLVAQRG